MDLVTIESGVTIAYYLISVFFLWAMARCFFRTKDPQEVVLYGIIMMPFVLRILRLK